MSPKLRPAEKKCSVYRRQKSAEGIVGPGVGKASEALRSERWSEQIGQVGNGDGRPERDEGN